MLRKSYGFAYGFAAFVIIQIIGFAGSLSAQSDDIPISSESANYAGAGIGLPQSDSANIVNANNPAEEAWRALMAKGSALTGKFRKNRVAAKAAYEAYYRDFFETGKRIAEQYPENDFKWIWIEELINKKPAFWKNIEEGAKADVESLYYTTPIDKEKLTLWIRGYEEKRKEYMENPNIAIERKRKLVFNELFTMVMEVKNKTRLGNKNEFLARVKKKFIEVIEPLKDQNDIVTAKRPIEALFFATDQYGLTFDDLSNFVSSFQDHPSPVIRNWAKAKLTLLGLKDQPMELTFKMNDGKVFDIRNYRGKVVLLDFWNIYCSSCIKKMPSLKKQYDKYKRKGFEVLSMDIDDESLKVRAEKIMAGIHADWPLIMLGGPGNGNEYKQYSDIFQKYGLVSVPQLMLLDKEGKLAMYNGTLQTEDFSAELERLIAQ